MPGDRYNPERELLYFVGERERIRVKKESGVQPPYTNDPILQTYRFCNVKRSDDKVSHWFHEHVLTEENIKYDLRSFLLFTALCRWINWPPTIKAIMDAKLWPRKKPDWKKIGRLIDEIGTKGKAWTGAYMIRAPKKRGAKKGKYVAEVVIRKELSKVLPELVKIFESENRTCQQVWGVLRKCGGFGSFMAGQVVADWTYCSLLRDAPDINIWAPMGPGSIRGVNRLQGIMPLNKRPKEADWLNCLMLVRKKIVQRLEDNSITAMDVQNILCETDKYLRVKLGEGRPRAKYRHHEY